MKFNKKAFTLTELIIALGVIGILAAVLMPIIANMLPDTNAIMAKRAYYAVQNVVSDMINNGDCYPDTSRASSTDLRRLGLEDGYRYPNCVGWETNASVEYWDSDAKDAVTGETKHLKGDPKEGKRLWSITGLPDFLESVEHLILKVVIFPELQPN